MREGLLKMKNIYIKFWLFWLSFSLKGAIINKYIEGDIGRFNHFLSVAYLSSQSKRFQNYKKLAKARRPQPVWSCKTTTSVGELLVVPWDLVATLVLTAPACG